MSSRGVTCATIALVCAVCLASSAQTQRAWYVDDDNCPGPGSGTLVDPFCSPQDALGAAAFGDEIWIAEGAYPPAQPNGSRTASFRLSNAPLFGGFPNGFGDGTFQARDPGLFVTVLTGDLNGDDVSVSCASDPSICDAHGGRCIDGFCIIKQNNGENSYHVTVGWPGAILDGITISSGNANGDGDLGRGGGMFNSMFFSPTVCNCKFIGNSANDTGGGMYNAQNTFTTVTGCTFARNAGGGLANFQFSVTAVTDCTFRENEGGGMVNLDGSSAQVSHSAFIRHFAGGMVNSDGSSVTVTNCSFHRHEVRAGLVNLPGSTAIVINSTFTGNISAGVAGGIFNEGDATVSGCLFSGNVAAAGAGMFNTAFSTATVTNCTFSGNAASIAGGLAASGPATPIVTNCVFWGNVDDSGTGEAAQIFIESASATVTYSLIQGLDSLAGEVGNIGGNPLFVRDPEDGGDGWGDDETTPEVDEGANDDFGDLHLQANSPGIDAGDNTAVAPDVVDLDGDGDIAEALPYDFDSRPRFVDTLIVPDDGNPDGLHPIVDMGAFEQLCSCDFNGDGYVDLLDHEVFAACLGGPGVTPNPSSPTTAQQCLDAFDVDLDFDVDLTDFARFLNSSAGS